MCRQENVDGEEEEKNWGENGKLVYKIQSGLVQPSQELNRGPLSGTTLKKGWMWVYGKLD